MFLVISLPVVRKTMLYIFHGDDDFSRHEALKLLLKESENDTMGGGNSTVLDGKSVTFSQLASACSATPFFGGKRIVVIEGLLQRLSPKRGKSPDRQNEKAGDKDFAGALEKYLPDMAPSTMLVLVDGELKSAAVLLKKLGAAGAQVRLFSMPKGARLHDWIQDRVTSKGGKISTGAVRLMAEFSGDNLWSLNNEMDKLFLYSRGIEITEEDVRETVTRSRDANQFAMVDAIVSRQADVAQRLLHRLLDEGTRATDIIAFVVRELGPIVRAREAIDVRLPQAEMQASIGVPPGFRLEKIIRQARGTSIDDLKALYRLLLDADLALKTGAMGEELTLGLLVADACLR